MSSLLADLQNRRAGEPEKRAFGGRVFASFLRGQKGQYPETKRGISDKSIIQNQYGFRAINGRHNNALTQDNKMRNLSSLLVGQIAGVFVSQTEQTWLRKAQKRSHQFFL
ncbi:hypothetical protein LGV61_07930 [Desulfurispirillum indicum]|uniref:hypothetical protein n=1 Tax=Desulfurispirillum indicum TaxID=936456 RepID=UPI001CF9C37F|nr:hypothetical protein [Desulfurispirillum indicum]UCZ55659.1 hypothetical protein LGV61_07930 [Desulfurispirillum indicum]